jgi:hypothetical protein
MSYPGEKRMYGKLLLAMGMVTRRRTVGMWCAFLLTCLAPTTWAQDRLAVWAVTEGVRIDPLTGKAFEEDSPATPGGLRGNYQAKNLIWDGAAKTVALEGAANEVLGFQLILDGPGVSGISVAASDLRNANGASIPAANLTLFRAFYIFVKQLGDEKWAQHPLQAGWYPEPLVPLSTPGIGAPFAIDGSNFGGAKPADIKNQTLWAELWIPKKTAPGLYQGTLTVTSSGGEARLNLAVKVFGFELPDETHITCEMLSYGEFSRKSTKEWRDKFYILGHQHRVTLLTTEAHRTSELTNQGGKFNWEGFDKAYGPAIDGSLYQTGPRAGIAEEYFLLPFGPALSRPDKGEKKMGKAWPIENPVKSAGTEVDFTPEYKQTFTALLQDASDHFAKQYPKTKLQIYQIGLDEAGFHKGDEGLALAQLRSLQGYMGIAKEVNRRHNNVIPRLDMGSGFAECKYDLDGNGKREGPSDVVSALGDGPGLWNINGSRISLAALAPVMQRGTPVWFYNGYEPRVGPTITNTEGVGPRTWPWVVWNSGMQGCDIWDFLQGYSDKPWEKGGVVQKENKLAGQALFFYPGEDVGAAGQVFASLRLKAFRRGAQDYEYFYLLAKKDGKPDRAKAHAARVVRGDINIKLDAKSIQDDEVGEVAKTKLAVGDKRHWSHNPEDYETLRYQVGALLEKK